MTAAVREAVWTVRPNLPLTKIRSMQEVVDESLKPWKWSAVVLAGLSLFALILAGIGIYGVVAYTASQRTSEIGVRMALGANPGHIRQMILRKALVLTAIGLGLGAMAALALNRAMASFLFGVGVNDPATYGLVLLVLGGISLLAALAPAVKASRTEPSVALHYE
jgi:ABC-type antimicrobial peptide transport system permease subunit